MKKILREGLWYVVFWPIYGVASLVIIVASDAWYALCEAKRDHWD